MPEPSLKASSELRHVVLSEYYTVSEFLVLFRTTASSLGAGEGMEVSVNAQLGRNIEFVVAVLSDPHASRIRALNWLYDGTAELDSIVALVTSNCVELASLKVLLRRMHTVDFLSDVLEHPRVGRTLRALYLPVLPKGDVARFFAALGRSRVNQLSLCDGGSPDFYHRLHAYLERDLLVGLSVLFTQEQRVLETVALLAKCRRLCALKIGNCEFRHPSSTFAAGLSRSVARLEFCDCTFLGDCGWLFLLASDVQRLAFFNVDGINGTRLGYALAARLKTSGLDVLDFFICNGVNETLAALGDELVHVRKLGVEYCGLDKTALELIALALQCPGNRLRELHLSYDVRTLASMGAHLLPALNSPACKLGKVSFRNVFPVYDSSAETAAANFCKRLGLLTLLQGQQVRRQRPSQLRRLPVELLRMVGPFIL
ncbi:hypothetical protein BASA81_006759 [Batrachochytrium salamandrivorans]|nr:hypothetical protein BASA81_006759 [Batrachochytrium salamandrivorans]